jgi:hypothetical protein
MGMSDRELLELAAKAIRREVARVEDYGLFFADHDRDEYSWNPLMDDGDALRLAVKLGIYDLWSAHLKYIDPSEVVRDPLQATRRAIVRAAAEIGKAMNNG